MAIYEIEVVEVLSRVIEMDAPTLEEAMQAVQDQYDNGDITLDSNDHDNMTQFNPLTEDGMSL